MDFQLGFDTINTDFLFPTKKSYPKSPLRYPGGKARAVDLLLSLIPSKTTTLVSPFLGGGSFEIAAAHCGLTVYAYDIFEPLIDFWQCLLENPKELSDSISKYYPLSRDQFYFLQKNDVHNKKEIGAVFFVLNRASFSGSTYSGGMSPGHPRFTISSINYLKNFREPNLHVGLLDFRKSIKKHKDQLLYLDPPYMIPQTLYGRNGDTHKDFQHDELLKILKNRDNWILSYNDSPTIRDMYFGYRLFVPEWKYGMSTDKNSRELIILSNDLPDMPGSYHA